MPRDDDEPYVTLKVFVTEDGDVQALMNSEREMSQEQALTLLIAGLHGLSVQQSREALDEQSPLLNGDIASDIAAMDGLLFLMHTAMHVNQATGPVTGFTT